MPPHILRRTPERTLPPGAGFVIAALAMLPVYFGIAAATGLL